MLSNHESSHSIKRYCIRRAYFALWGNLDTFNSSEVWVSGAAWYRGEAFQTTFWKLRRTLLHLNSDCETYHLEHAAVVN